jgi:uncharacterized membrane protein YjjP (DUF1212 family)
MKPLVVTSEALLCGCLAYLIAPKLLDLIPILTPVVVIIDITVLLSVTAYVLEIRSVFAHFFTGKPLVKILHPVTA